MTVVVLAIWLGGAAMTKYGPIVLSNPAKDMSPTATRESVGALLRVMTDAEIEDFIAKWVPERFEGRTHVVAVAGEPIGGRRAGGATTDDEDRGRRHWQ